MIGPDVMKKIMAKSAVLICIILGWIGMIMVLMTAIVGNTRDVQNPDGSIDTFVKISINHANLWPILFGFFCAGAAMVMGSKMVKISLCGVLFITSFWVLVNTLTQAVGFPSIAGLQGLAQGVAPLMAPTGAIGGFLGFLGGGIGMLGVAKYMK